MAVVELAHTVARSYVVLLLASIVANAVAARVYGDFCGIGLYELYTFGAWKRALGLTASPVCTTLLKLCEASQTVVSYAWANLLTSAVLAVGAAAPTLQTALRSVLRYGAAPAPTAP